MDDATMRAHLRKHLVDHLDQLGYSTERSGAATSITPEIRRVSPVRGRIAYGETVLHADLQDPRCHQRLLFFSQRRTRHRSSILFFIGVSKADEPALTALLQELDIRSATRGGHVHVVAVPAPNARSKTTRRS